MIHGFTHKIFFLKNIHITSLWELMTLRAWTIWTPGEWLAWLMKGTTRHYYILNIYAVALIVIDEKIFLSFAIICLWELLIHRGMASLHPTGKFDGFM